MYLFDLGPVEALLADQSLGSVYLNPLKYAIRSAIAVGVPANTIVLLLLLPLVASIIAAARHLVGVRGFGIFLPAALSVVFISTGPLVGIILFFVIVFMSTFGRILIRKLKLKLQYLPKMSLIVWFVVLGVLGVLFLAPVIQRPDLTNVSIFPVLILVLLAEDFAKVQTGKSVRTAIEMTSETLILSLISYLFLTLSPIQRFAFLNPEWFLILIFVFNFFLGKYVGLRLIELWRFRKLISG